MSVLDGPAFDLQIAGVQDDGTTEGVVRSKIISGDLVRVPLFDLDVGSFVQGTGSASLNRNAYSNSDHSGVGYNLSTPAGIATNLSTMYAVLYGRTVGVRFRKLGSTPPFSLIVDGVPYGVPLMQRQTYFDAALGSLLGNGKEGIFVVSDLPDGPHSVRVVVGPDSAVARTLVVYGFLAERGAGYAAATPLDSLFGGGTLTAAAVAVPVTDNAGNANHGIKAILYQNTDVASRTVTITWNGVAVQTLDVAAGKSGRIDLSSLGINPGSAPNLAHQADVAAKVNFVCLGSF